MYGEPPQDVDFVRLVDDKVVGLETIKVNGEKGLRTEEELNLEEPQLAQGQELQPSPAKTPTKPR